MISDERFFAWLDGELGQDEAAAIDQLVASDPELRRRAEQHQALSDRLQRAFNRVAEQPVPGRLRDAARARDAEVIDLSERRSIARPISRPMQWAAMAATLAIGVVAGTMLAPSGSGLVDRENGQLVASGELENALYSRLASAPADEGARIGLTFRDANGDLCRSFTDDRASGLACYQGGDWRIRGLFQGEEGHQSEFRMAAGTDPRIAELIDSTMAGEPLDAAAERQALDALR